MSIGTLVGAVLYFMIGWILSDWLNTEGKDEVATFIFLFWPLMIIFLGMVIVMGLAAIVATLLSKIFGLIGVEHREKPLGVDGEHGEGGNTNGTV